MSLVIGLLTQKGVFVDFREPFVEGEKRADGSLGVLRHMALPGGKGLDGLQRSGAGLLPGLVAGENMGQIPFPLGVDLTTFFDLLSHSASPYLSASRRYNTVIYAYDARAENPAAVAIPY